MQFHFAELAAPVRHQAAMRRTGHRIFIDARGRREVARNEITVITTCCDIETAVEFSNGSKIGLEVLHAGGIGKFCNQNLAGTAHLQYRYTQHSRQFLLTWQRLQIATREIQREQVAVARHDQLTTQRMKTELQLL